MSMREHVIVQIRQLLDESGRAATISLYGKKKRQLEKKFDILLAKLRKRYRIKTKRGPRVD